MESNIQSQSALSALSALARGHRLAVFRLLVRAGPEGMAAGDIAEKLDLPASSLSFHLSHLKQGGIIAIVGDLHVQEGIELGFFDQPAITSTVPAELALKQDAALIPVYAIRKPDGLNFQIVMHEPIEHSDPMTMTQEINDGLEELVREHMDQWFWIHRRWKSA